jgi:hypothetical protein
MHPTHYLVRIKVSPCFSATSGSQKRHACFSIQLQNLNLPLTVSLNIFDSGTLAAHFSGTLYRLRRQI